MAVTKNSPIVSTDWLFEHLEAPDIVVVHAVLAFEKTLEELTAEYDNGRIPSAVMFDVDVVADSNDPLPHMLPPAEKFSSMMRKMGIGDGQRIVVYDTSGNFCASRVWWMFKTFGVEDVCVLDGGLPKWIAEGKPLADGEPRPRQERHFTARFQSMGVRDMDDVRQAVQSGPSQGGDQVIDARSSDRFTAKEKETRDGLRSGHMPNALNVYYKDTMNENATMKTAQELKALFEAAGVDLKKPTITTCGSGVTAAILTLGLEIAGHKASAVYDGSWTQWGAVPENDVVEG